MTSFSSLHPSVMQMGPSAEQLSAISARGSSQVVVAGSGSGKTLTLVARYLALLADGLPLRSIVAVTFTRKAAREMRNRVRREIGLYLARADLAAEERDRWQSHYDALDAARIGTIHSLCAELLRAHPAEAAIDPLFEVLEEGQVNVLRGETVQAALAWAAENAATTPLFSLHGERDLAAILQGLLSARLAAGDCFAAMPEPLWPAWESRIIPRLRAFVDDPGVNYGCAALAALRSDGMLARAAAAGDKLAAPLAALLALWDTLRAARLAEDWVTICACLRDLRGNMKQVGQAANWQPARPKDIIKELQGCYDEVIAPLMGARGISLALDRLLCEQIPAWRQLYTQAVATYSAARRERQALDFDDLEDGALRLLQEHPEVLARWQGELRALLVDEYQDTNRRQNALVQILDGGGGKRFLVGDAKQSIYRFRGADVTVFRGERDAITRAGGREQTLATSYRGHAALLAALNHLLPPALPAGRPEQAYREPFAPLHPHRTQPAPGFIAPYVELQLALGSKAEGALDAAARALAERLVELVEEAGITLAAGPGGRALDYGDVAILCRSAGSFAPYEDALEAAGIPFLTVAGRGFYGRPEIRDLLNALAALADPSDNLALAGLLRSPVMGLSDAALYRLSEAARAAAGGSRPVLWEALGAAANQPAADPRLARSHGLITRLHEQVGRITVAELLKAFFDATAYHAALLAAGQARAARNVAKLLRDAHASGIVGVGEFLAYIAGLRDTGTREGEARATAEGAVQIMTVHAAKGLEFPVVVIGDLAHQPQGRTARWLLDPEVGFVPAIEDETGAAPAIYRLAQQAEADREDAESGRLFYVAATRAREHLILNGCALRNASGDLRRNGGWLDRLLDVPDLELKGLPSPEPDGRIAGILALAGGAVSLGCHLYDAQYAATRPARPYAAPRPARAGASAAPGLAVPALQGWTAGPASEVPPTEPERPQRVWRVVPRAQRPTAPAWVIGSLVHAALAAWRFPDRGFDAWAEAQARTYGLTDETQLRHAAAQARRLLERFCASPLHAEMAGAERLLHEVPYAEILSEGSFAYRIIDALYYAGGAWTVVEFKTDRIPREQLAQVMARHDYAAQAGAYARAVQRLLRLPGLPRTLLCLLNCDGEIHVENIDRIARP